jgi:hypothetical protein
LDQTNLDEQLLLILKGGGGIIHEVAPDWPHHRGGRLGPGVSAPLLGLFRLSFVSRVFSYLPHSRKVMCSPFVSM